MSPTLCDIYRMVWMCSKCTRQHNYCINFAPFIQHLIPRQTVPVLRYRTYGNSHGARSAYDMDIPGLRVTPPEQPRKPVMGSVS